MNISLVSVRYAKALFNLCVEKGKLDVVYKDIQLLTRNCADEEDFCEFVKSPIIRPQDKKEMFKTIYTDVLNPITLKFLYLVVDNDREKILDSIFRNFVSFYKKEKNIKTVTVYSAFNISKKFKDKIKALLAKELNSNIELTVVNRPDLLGGFILKVDDKMVDASIKGKLKKIREHLIKE